MEQALAAKAKTMQSQPTKHYGITVITELVIPGNPAINKKVFIEQRGSCHNTIEVVATLTGDAANNEELAYFIRDFMEHQNIPDPNFFWDVDFQAWRPITK